ncbi:hypothetical protein SNARM312S_04137 [Streptomyces narbonensis]
MDYCHACRRHLNGALACAGCGTPVEELRYETPHAPVPPAEPEYVYELDVVEPPRPATGGRRAARTAARGRSAARGGRRARARRGRTVLLGTVGLVLAAGTLGVVQLALQEPEASGAATAVQEQEVVETSIPPVPPESTESPESTEGAGPPDGSAPSEVTVAPSTNAPTRPPDRHEHRETFVDGIESGVDAFLGLLRGDNTGKMIVSVNR